MFNGKKRKAHVKDNHSQVGQLVFALGFFLKTRGNICTKFSGKKKTLAVLGGVVCTLWYFLGPKA